MVARQQVVCKYWSQLKEKQLRKWAGVGDGFTLATNGAGYRWCRTHRQLLLVLTDHPSPSSQSTLLSTVPACSAFTYHSLPLCCFPAPSMSTSQTMTFAPFLQYLLLCLGFPCLISAPNNSSVVLLGSTVGHQLLQLN